MYQRTARTAVIVMMASSIVVVGALNSSGVSGPSISPVVSDLSGRPLSVGSKVAQLEKTANGCKAVSDYGVQVQVPLGAAHAPEVFVRLDDDCAAYVSAIKFPPMGAPSSDIPSGGDFTRPTQAGLGGAR